MFFHFQNEPTVSLGEKMDEIVKKRKAKKPKADGTENELKCEICSMPFEEKGQCLNNLSKASTS